MAGPTTTGMAPARPGWARPFRPRLRAATAYLVHRVLARRPATATLAEVVESGPRAATWFTAAERVSKERLFGCRMCGQCALPATGYACPMTCPKELRNGPCGGVGPDGGCEVFPAVRCVWVQSYERACSAGHAEDLDRLHRPIDQRRWGESSWLNHWRGRDEDLWTEPVATDPGGCAPPSILRRELGLTPVGDR